MSSHFPKPGTSSFVHELSLRVQRQLNNNVPFDESIFRWILYCLIAGDKHLILRTRSRESFAVQKVAKSILFSIFGLNTVSIKLDKESTPTSLLLSLFPRINSSISSPVSQTPSQSPAISVPPTSFDRKARLGPPHLLMTPTNRSSSYVRGSHGHLSVQERNQERVSLLADSVLPHGHTGRPRLSVAATIAGVTDDDRGSIRGIRPASGRGFLPPDIDASSVTFAASQHVQQLSQSQNIPVFQFPHAVVVHGLETASKAVQETLWDMLRTRSVVLDREGAPDEKGVVSNMPDGFILIYLDRFSFNASIVIPPSPNSSAILGSVTLEPTRSPLLRRTTVLSREYIEYLGHLAHDTPMSPSISMYISNLLSAIRYHPQLNASNITSRCAQDLTEFTKTVFVLTGSSMALQGTKDGDIEEEDETIKRRPPMTPDDVKRVVRHVVGHRVSVREGVHEELLGSVVVSAIQRSQSTEREPRRTIREVLSEAIAAVN
ncbi:SubName: Full=Uncharacterized protein {ECO:0000313/EMBL:CCA68633.1} [Serendipita indica DSM 11827]|nr:SubName: Full=Uncharacterized protein {ECO:0000313/EMBL:CCA68633.1} [Serendipita indica DSM 11827]